MAYNKPFFLSILAAMLCACATLSASPGDDATGQALKQQAAPVLAAL